MLILLNYLNIKIELQYIFKEYKSKNVIKQIIFIIYALLVIEDLTANSDS